MAAKEIADWCEIIRIQWIGARPSGTIFRSRDVFDWVASGGVELTAADFKVVSASGRQFWRDRLSKALRKLYDRGELIHPGISRHAWRIP
jgi:hypothetical protein